jgi:hypothetical protein
MDASTSRSATKPSASFGLEGELTTLGALRQQVAPLLPSGSAATTQSEHPAVFVTALLDIHPPECDQRFWHSATWQQSVRGLDCCYAGFVVTNNCVLHVYRKRWPGENVPFLAWTVSLFLLLSLLQSYGAYHSKPLYHRARPTLVALNRCAPPAACRYCVGGRTWQRLVHGILMCRIGIKCTSAKASRRLCVDELICSRC